MVNQGMSELTVVFGLVNGIGATVLALVWKSFKAQDERVRILERSTDVMQAKADRMEKQFDTIDGHLKTIIEELADLRAHVDYLERTIRP